MVKITGKQQQQAGLLYNRHHRWSYLSLLGLVLICFYFLILQGPTENLVPGKVEWKPGTTITATAKNTSNIQPTDGRRQWDDAMTNSSSGITNSVMDTSNSNIINNNINNDGNSTNTNTATPWKYFPWELPKRQTLDDDESSNNNNNNNHHDRDVAVFMISMGQTAAKFRIVERLWLSLRRIGNFFGPFVVLTDASHDRYLGIQQTDPNFIQIRPPNDHYNWDANFVDAAMPYKRFKTYLLEYLTTEDHNDQRLANVKYVLYLDADVVVGKPLQPWLEFSKSQFQTSLDATTTTIHSAPVSIIFFQGNFDDMPIQSGQFMLDVRTAEPCLVRWRKLIDENPQLDKDQYSLKILQESSSSSSAAAVNDCKMEIIPQDPWLVFVKKENIRTFLATKECSTFMHVQNTGHARYMQDNVVQKFFRQLLQLSDEEKKLNWKTPIRPSPEWSREQLDQQSTQAVP